MHRNKTFQVKREQRKSFLLKEIATLVRSLSADEPLVTPLFVNRIDISKDSGICYVYFSTLTDEEAFYEGLKILKLYKPSMRKALAQAMKTRYVPDLIFRYDKTKEKERKVNLLLDEIQQELEELEE